MAKRSLLKLIGSDGQGQALHKLSSGELSYGSSLSQWIEGRLVEQLAKHPLWVQALPVATGSWARGELCPRSDLDIVFLGQEDVVLSLVQDFLSRQWPLRYRVPLDPEDWTQGVEAQDILAIPYARALVPEAESLLVEQQKRLKAKGISLWKKLLKFMREEQARRNDRFDSVSNYLEPNLKYGPGALRDTQQADYILDLFFAQSLGGEFAHARKILARNRRFYLELRQRLHLLGGLDILSAGEQRELAQQMGFSKPASLMQKLQRSLAQVSFIHDWVMEFAQASKRRREEVHRVSLGSLNEVFEALKNDPSLLMQGRVRWEVNDSLFSRPQKRAIGRQLNQVFRPQWGQEFFAALFRSRVLERCLPELARVKGVVQHDHYHRFTVDAHLSQALKEVLRVQAQPKLLGRLAPLVKELEPQDFRILLWTSLYHDLAKGKGGDHSTKGEALVKKDFIDMGLSLRLTVEVAWMVRHHLLLSTAAFRMNSQDPSTWARLHGMGVKGPRLTRLAVFTAIDIRATNPEAWTDWKEQLLADLVSSLRTSYATRFMKFLEVAERHKFKDVHGLLPQMDPAVIEALPHSVLLEELRTLSQVQQEDLPVRALRNSKGELWLRFHRCQDRSGLFLGFVRSVFATGAHIQHSSVRTLPDVGVYDWFHVRTAKTPAQLLRTLNLVSREAESMASMESLRPQLQKIRFDQITLVGQDAKECIISFRGRDQKGLLLAAAQALFDLNLVIRWARVHTWGRQVDDVFAVEKLDLGKLETVLESLRHRFKCNISSE